MATLADSLISSSSRAVKLRMRPDLSARQHRYHGRCFWVLKEPVGLNYFRFHEEEYAILQMLDGETSLEDIKEKFEHEFTPQKITYNDLQQFIGMLHRSGLVISESPGQGKQLKKRGDAKRYQELMGKFANVFSLRFRGIDPEKILKGMYPYTSWFFSAWFFCLWLFVGLSALTLVMVQFDTFQARLPSFHEFFAAKNWIWLAITMAVVKVLHEFGHGLSCTHFGGECHEMGFMLLVFTPALYCNVSDSWMLPNKYKRAAIGAAGMYVEVFMASIATFIWWSSEPGLLNQIALSVMFICSVSTVVFNGNPLLRFDGYYILMDLAEIPNLRQKSTEVVKRFLAELCLGLEQPESPFLPQHNQVVFGLYTVAAVVYRWLVLFSILYFLNKVFEPYGLKIIGQLIALSGLVGLVIQPLWQLIRFFYTPGRMHKVKKERLYPTIGVVATALLFVAFVPLPYNVRCSLEILPKEAHWIYVDVPGKMTELAVRPGQHVNSGVMLCSLTNEDLQREVVELEGQLAETESEIMSLQEQRVHDTKAGLQVKPAKERYATIGTLLAEKREKLKRLQVTSPIDGTVIPPPMKSQERTPPGQLPGWSGSPFDRKNSGAHFAESDLVCLIGDPQQVEAVLVVDQSDIDLIKVHDSVRVKLDAYPGRTFHTLVAKIANDNMEASPLSLSIQGGGDLDTRTDATGQHRPLTPSYQVRTEALSLDGLSLQMGMRGRGKVSVAYQSVGRRVFRYLSHTFHFDL